MNKSINLTRFLIYAIGIAALIGVEIWTKYF